MYNPFYIFKNRINRFIVNSLRNKYKLVPLEESIHIDSAHNYLSGRNVLIAGVGKNIGINICREMEKYGAKIICVDMDKDQIETLRTSSGYICYHLDSTDEPQCMDLFVKLEKAGTVIDAFIYNAGWSTEHKSARNTSIPEWRKTIDTNFLGPVH